MYQIKGTQLTLIKSTNISFLDHQRVPSKMVQVPMTIITAKKAIFHYSNFFAFYLIIIFLYPQIERTTIKNKNSLNKMFKSYTRFWLYISIYICIFREYPSEPFPRSEKPIQLSAAYYRLEKSPLNLKFQDSHLIHLIKMVRAGRKTLKWHIRDKQSGILS